MQNASRALAASALLLVSAGPALAQDAQKKAPPQPAAANPIVVQRINDQFFIGPEYKLTDMHGRTGQLVGGTGGILMQETFVLGGSVYRLVDGPADWELTYGGFVFGAQMPPAKKIRFGAKSLIGWGQASNVDTFTVYPLPMYANGNMTIAPIGFHHGGDRIIAGFPTSARVHYKETFFVLEPQGDLLFAIGDKIRFGVSGGYRWTDSSNYFQHAINGATGTVTLQVGF